MSICRSLIVFCLSVFFLLSFGSRGAAASEFVLSPEGNNLWAYDAASLAPQLVIEGVNNRDPGVAANSTQRRDINGQVCVAPDGQHILTGEDTVEGTGSSHNPLIAGWGYFELSGGNAITAIQVGKLAPNAPDTGPAYKGDPDNFGCGFLDDKRILTTAIGNTLPGDEANGQLFLWFADPVEGFEKGFETVIEGDVTFQVGAVQHCAIDESLATAGGIAIDDNGDVYVAANRFDDSGAAGTVWRYSGKWPSTLEECTPEYIAANITKTAVIDLLPAPIPFEPIAPTPSQVVISPQDTLYVSSVFTGTVSEFTKGGQFVRDVYPLSPLAPRTGPTGNTPFGLAFTSDGALWIADLGIVLADSAPGQGSVVRQPFDDHNNPVPLGATTVNDGLDYPDGLGVYTPSE